MGYEPGLIPETPEEIPQFLTEELRRVAAAFGMLENIRLVELHAEPSRPRDGMIVLADGTNWNPGSGGGYYGRHNGAWTFLG